MSETDHQLLVFSACARDQAAAARDVDATARDERAAVRERERTHRLGDCAVERAAAARDRDAAGRDRGQSARDRLALNELCEELRRELRIAETDALTGARTRAAGLTDLTREIDRAHRTGGTLVGVYADLVGLKIVNDTRGHAAGDALLQTTVSHLRAHLRTYDVIVRLGGDEFLCAMPNATIEDARDRFADIQSALAADADPGQIKYGIAQLADNDDVDEFIQRADANLPVSKPR